MTVRGRKKLETKQKTSAVMECCGVRFTPDYAAELEGVHVMLRLAVELNAGRKKLAFQRRADPNELVKFLTSAEAEFGYRIFMPKDLTN